VSDNLRDLLRFTDEQKQELRRRMMTDSLRDRIEAVIASHVYNEWHTDESGQCMCGKCGTSYPAHVADVVTEALPELNPDHVRAKYLKDWEEGYDEGYSAGGGGC
jgi:hypothetical protein